MLLTSKMVASGVSFVLERGACITSQVVARNGIWLKWLFLREPWRQDVCSNLLRASTPPGIHANRQLLQFWLFVCDLCCSPSSSNVTQAWTFTLLSIFTKYDRDGPWPAVGTKAWGRGAEAGQTGQYRVLSCSETRSASWHGWAAPGCSAGLRCACIPPTPTPTPL